MSSRKFLSVCYVSGQVGDEQSLVLQQQQYLSLSALNTELGVEEEVVPPEREQPEGKNGVEDGNEEEEEEEEEEEIFVAAVVVR